MVLAYFQKYKNCERNGETDISKSYFEIKLCCSLKGESNERVKVQFTGKKPRETIFSNKFVIYETKLFKATTEETTISTKIFKNFTSYQQKEQGSIKIQMYQFNI